MIHYSISSSNPAGHYFDVELIIPQPQADGQILRMPAWIPGSYMIRDFARNIVEINAKTADAELILTQLDKSSWQLPACDDVVTVTYKVYAWDLSVRSAHLDTTHGFFNGSSVFLEVVGQSDSPCSVDIIKPAHDDCRHWRLATTLSSRNESETYDFKFGGYRAQNYQDLIDHPVEMGTFTQFHFIAGGIRHDMVLSGRFECDQQRLILDLTNVCEQHIKMFDTPAPMDRYLFLVMVVGEGYGGLEHSSSTSLLCTRNHLPQPGQSELTDEYQEFLGLCSHEYFHSWNVKRIKPQVFKALDLSSEVYTPLLWAFEGITSYYDDLALVRCGCISVKKYLELLGQTITRVQRGQGRLRQSAATSSFNAWSKFYKQDENAVNAIVSYYAKGSLIALCIDLTIRNKTHGEHSLDDVMRQLWKNYQDTGQGISEFEIQSIVNTLLGEDISEFLYAMIYGVENLPLTELLQSMSVALTYRSNSGHQDKGGIEKSDLPKSMLGINIAESDQGLKVVSIHEHSAAQQAGLSADDMLLAIDGLKATIKSYQSMLQLSEPGTIHELVFFRRDELMTAKVELAKPALDTAVLSVIDEKSQALKNWLVLA